MAPSQLILTWGLQKTHSPSWKLLSPPPPPRPPPKLVLRTNAIYPPTKVHHVMLQACVYPISTLFGISHKFFQASNELIFMGFPYLLLSKMFVSARQLFFLEKCLMAFGFHHCVVTVTCSPQNPSFKCTQPLLWGSWVCVCAEEAEGVGLQGVKGCVRGTLHPPVLWEEVLICRDKEASFQSALHYCFPNYYSHWRWSLLYFPWKNNNG